MYNGLLLAAISFAGAMSGVLPDAGAGGVGSWDSCLCLTFVLVWLLLQGLAFRWLLQRLDLGVLNAIRECMSMTADGSADGEDMRKSRRGSVGWMY